VEVINAGVPTWTSTQELFLLTTEVLDWEPDVVVIYDGRNDLHYGVLPDAQPHWLPRASQQLTYLEDSQNPWRRNFMTFFLIDTLLIHPRDRSHPEADMSNRNGVQWGYQPHQDIVDAYARNLDSMSALLIANDVQPLLIFQPSLLTTSKPLTDLEQDNLDALQPAYIDAMAIMLRDARLVAEDVAQERAIPWVDFSSIFDDEVGLMLVDDVHQSNAGNEVLARRLGEILSPLAPQ
jgi:lysophospholipase L1-like esterase